MNREAQPMDFAVTTSKITLSHWVLWYKFRALDVTATVWGTSARNKVGTNRSPTA